MRFISARKQYSTYAKTGLLGLVLISLAGCSAGDSTTPAVTSSGSAALQGPIAFVNNRGIGNQNTLSVVGTDSQGNLKIVSTMGTAGEFENNALGDMQISNGEWVFVNLTAGNKISTIDPISGATPIHEANLPTGTRPNHIYRDPTDGEVIWSMNDGDATNGNDAIKCGGIGTSVTVLHNSHIPSGGQPPRVLATTCTLASGHGVAAFSQPTVSDGTIPKYAVITNEKGGQMAFLDNDENSTAYMEMRARLDLCTDLGQAGLSPAGASCDDENITALNVPFTANGSKPHGIRWSKLTGKIYSLQEGYGEIIEVDPKLIVPGPGNNQAAITRRLSLTGQPYSSYGITPDGRFLFLRGRTTTDPDHIIGKLAVVDLSAAGALSITPVLDLQDIVPSTFKFSPDGQRLYLLASDATTGSGNQSTNQRKNLLLVFNPSTFPVAPQVLAEVGLLAASGHNFDVLVQGAGQASAVLVSNGTPSATGSVSLINSNHQRINDLLVGINPGAVMFYSPGVAAAGNQATSSLTGGSAAAPTVLAERLDDHGMPE